MKKLKLFAIAFTGVIVLGIFGCQKKNETPTSSTDQTVAQSTKAQIKSLGFSTASVVKTKGGYIVEGDIFLSEASLAKKAKSQKLTVAKSEQYQTTNTVSGLPRTVTISVTNLPSVYSDAVDGAIARYNALGLKIYFQRASSGSTGDIDVAGFDSAPNSNGSITLGSSGFPDDSGNPFGTIQMNTNNAAYGSNPNLDYLTSVVQHEIGHCIGLRHTDYFNRSYSCGYVDANNDEGQSDVGAIQIPGTPSSEDPDSFMLACSNGGNRSFNANDVIALNYLYK